MRIIYYDRLTADKNVESEEEAKEILSRQFPRAFFGSWEENYEGDRRWLSVWEDEESAIDDSGEGAVARIEEVA